MTFRNASFVAAAAWALFIALPRAEAIVVGQIDDFEDGTTDSWANGGIQPVNIANGGPLGLNDNYLQVSSDSSGMNGRLTVFNRNQWLGNYISAGVNEIALDLNNLGTTTVSIHLAFKSATFNGASGYLTTIPVQLAPNSGWQHFSFSITPAAMTAIGGPSAFNTFFSNPAELRIINESGTTSLNGDLIAAEIGIDNIAAIAVPEPGSLILIVAIGGTYLGWTKLRRGLKR